MMNGPLSISSIEGRLSNEALQPDLKPNSHISSMLSKVLQPTMSDVNAVEVDDTATDEARTELDSCANMLVMGWNAYFYVT